MLRPLALLIFLAVSRLATAQYPVQVTGARPAALGGTALASSDHWALFGNAARLTEAKHFSAGLAAQQPYSIGTLTGGSVAAAIPFGEGQAAGAGITFFSDNGIYWQYHASTGYARRFGNISGALIFNLTGRQHLDEVYQDETVFFATAALVYHLNDKLQIGALVVNPTLSGISNDEAGLVPTSFTGSVRWETSEKVTLLADVQKDLVTPAQGALGVAYRPGEKLELRYGLRTAYFEHRFGLGLYLGQVRVDLAFSLHRYLGFTPYAGLNYMQE